MNKGISKIISDFKSKSVSIVAVEKALGFSNGMIGKAAKGKYIMSTQKINALLEYYGNHFPSSKDEVAKMLEPAPTPEYKEGGLYRFENRVFIEIEMKEFKSASQYKIGKPFWMNSDGTTRGATEEEIKSGLPLPLNKEDEKPVIKYKAPDKDSYDGEKVNKYTIDEAGQWQEPKKYEKAFEAVPLLSVEQEMTPKKIGNNIGKGKPEKPEKVMPQGLSKADQLRWMRENA